MKTEYISVYVLIILPVIGAVLPYSFFKYYFKRWVLLVMEYEYSLFYLIKPKCWKLDLLLRTARFVWLCLTLLVVDHIPLRLTAIKVCSERILGPFHCYKIADLQPTTGNGSVPPSWARSGPLSQYIMTNVPFPVPFSCAANSGINRLRFGLNMLTVLQISQLLRKDFFN